MITVKRALPAVALATGAAIALAACGSSSDDGSPASGGGSGKTYVALTSADFPPGWCPRSGQQCC